MPDRPPVLPPPLPRGALTARLPVGADPDALVETFLDWVADQGLRLYPHQEEALLALVTDAHVIVSTPTGSGKSLVAVAAHAAALARGQRSYYTAPLKALVSEKFFALVEVFGADQVGMVTGDSAVNPDAPIVCCTAEILANIALRDGVDADVGQVVADEFHFYADPQRGWAWQVPLLELTRAQFVLMSATLGDVSFFADDLTRRTGREVVVVDDAVRPVPLTYSYTVEPLTETLLELVTTRRAPVYVVHFTQKEAVERAQGLVSAALTSREQRDAIAAELGSFRFAGGFGQTLSRLLRHGVGVHHAGMLPRYRRVVERLTQRGLLPVVCGTDTLGVGINVPIRTVVLTSLVKYDGQRSRHLTAREFHQIAGRAGRAGFDTVGEVLVMAPEHVIENRKALLKAGDDPKKLRKVVRKQAPQGQVNWTESTFERLRDAPPEPLTSHFQVSHAMVLNVLARQDRTGADPIAAMRHLLLDNHEPPAAQARLTRRTVEIYRSLRTSGVVERPWVADPDAPHGRRLGIRLTAEIPEEFALNQALSPFAYAALDLADPADPGYALDVVSIIEATLDDPRQVLAAQESKAKGEAVAAMKAEGMEYEERMAALADITYPKPLAEPLTAAFAAYRRTNPWVADLVPSPKSVVRDMAERGATFGDYVAAYQLQRTEGVLLRYLTDAYRALRQVVPAERRTEDLDETIEWLGDVVRRTDSSLLEEWELLASGSDVEADGTAALRATDDDAPPPVSPRVLRALVRQAMFRRVELAAREAYDDLAALGDTDTEGVPWTADRWAAALDPYYDDHPEILTGPAARGPALFQVTEEPTRWLVRQTLDDPDSHHDWRLEAVVDPAATASSGTVALQVTDVGPW